MLHSKRAKRGFLFKRPDVSRLQHGEQVLWRTIFEVVPCTV